MGPAPWAWGPEQVVVWVTAPLAIRPVDTPAGAMACRPGPSTDEVEGACLGAGVEAWGLAEAAAADVGVAWAGGAWPRAGVGGEQDGNCATT